MLALNYMFFSTTNFPWREKRTNIIKDGWEEKKLKTTRFLLQSLLSIPPKKSHSFHFNQHEKKLKLKLKTLKLENDFTNTIICKIVRIVVFGKKSIIFYVLYFRLGFHWEHFGVTNFFSFSLILKTF